MKSRLLFFIFVCILGISAHATPPLYERTLKSFEVTSNSEIHFVLDNNWVLICNLSPAEESNLYTLDRMLGTHVRLDTNPLSPSLKMILENPLNQGSDKLSFPVSITKAVYQTLPHFIKMDIYDYILFATAYATLSDGTMWSISIKTALQAHEYWSPGDRILITKKFNSAAAFTLINLDVSGQLWTDFHRTPISRWFQHDPRTLDAHLYQIEQLSQ